MSIPGGFVYGAQSWLVDDRSLYATLSADLAARQAAGEDLFVAEELLQTNR